MVNGARVEKRDAAAGAVIKEAGGAQDRLEIVAGKALQPHGVGRKGTDGERCSAAHIFQTMRPTLERMTLSVLMSRRRFTADQRTRFFFSLSLFSFKPRGKISCQLERTRYHFLFLFLTWFVIEASCWLRAKADLPATMSYCPLRI